VPTALMFGGHIVVPSLALIAALSTAAVYYVARVRSEPPAKPVAAFSPVGPEDRIEGLTAFANAQAKLKDMAPPIAVSPGSPEANDSKPVLDFARDEKTGPKPR
jgi:hypothetical protein